MKNRMKILWFVDKQFDCALDRTTWLKTIECLQQRHTVSLVTEYRLTKPQFPELRNKIIYIRSPKLRFFKRFGFYLNQLRHYERLILLHQPTRVLLNTHNFLLARRSVQLKRKYHYRNFLDVRTLPVAPSAIQNLIDRNFFRQSLALAARRFDGVSYITEELREYCRGTYQLPFHNSEVWTSGVDLSLFRPDAKSFSEKAFRLIYHGNVVENRGLDNAIRALNLVRDRGVEMMFLGEGSGSRAMKSLVSRLGLTGRVTFHPSVPNEEVPRYIREADAGILPFPDWPGWNTSSPLKLFEYLACGRPVIVTRIPAHVNAVGGQEFAFWADASSPEAIARAIGEAEGSRKEFSRLGQKARQFVGDHYSWEKQAEKLEGFLLGGERERSV